MVTPTELDFQYLMQFMHSLANAAKRITLSWYQKENHLQDKADQTPVTIADQETEQHLRSLIAEHFPDHGFLGEETGEKDLHAEYIWIVDPIDGTKNYTIGAPIFGTLIALLQDGAPIAGLLDMPVLQQRWFSYCGRSTELNGETCQTDKCDQLATAIIHATTPDMFNPRQSRQFDHLSAHCRFRLFGKDCYAYGLLASGFLHLIMEADLKAVDILPLVPIIENAGGKITDWQGHPLSLKNHRTALASCNPVLHELALSRISGL